jgi:hypothetical protein
MAFSPDAEIVEGESDDPIGRWRLDHRLPLLRMKVRIILPT